jgi:hypothetical protein
MEQKKAAAKLLRVLAELLERNSSADLEDVIEGRASLVISKGHQTPSRREGIRSRDVEKRRQPNGRDLGEVVAQLRHLGSRDDGFALLLALQLTKRELEELARFMDVPVVREDDSAQLRRKIVEESIGSRLNSQAIRGG